ncbi:MAG TPA: DUF805 domain-containing protein [Brevundimonas sp.]|jgi:uncharacterized membrane protein YhaH (DUF805 family)
MTLRDKLFSFDGRLRRRDWWLWSIGTGIAYFTIAMVAGPIVFGQQWGAMTDWGQASRIAPWQLATFDVVTYAPSLWIQTALATKRTHDRNNGAALAAGMTVFYGLLTFGATAVDLLPSGMLTPASIETLLLTLNGVGALIGFYLFVVLGVLDGTHGPNRFGPSPKGLSGETPAFMTPGGLE